MKRTVRHDDYQGLLEQKLHELSYGKREFVSYKNTTITHNGTMFVIRHRLLLYPITKLVAKDAASFVISLLNFQSMSRQLKTSARR